MPVKALKERGVSHSPWANDLSDPSMDEEPDEDDPEGGGNRGGAGPKRPVCAPTEPYM